MSWESIVRDIRGARVIVAEGGDHGSMVEDEDVVREISDAL